jgi:hypothetical protein
MSTRPPESIATFIQATNDHNSDALRATLTNDAVVTEVVERDGETVVTAQVVRAFDGSPDHFHFHFITDDNKVTAVMMLT